MEGKSEGEARTGKARKGGKGLRTEDAGEGANNVLETTYFPFPAPCPVFPTGNSH
jgi:hypothetical protein